MIKKLNFKCFLFIFLILIVSTFYKIYSLSEIIITRIITNLADVGITIITVSPLESIYTKFYMSSIFTLCLFIPLITFLIYLYVSPGLYKKEKAMFKKVTIPISLIFCIGFMIGSIFLSQQLNYFIISQSVLNENTTITLSNYVSFIFSIGALTGILLCYPSVIYILYDLKLISIEMLSKHRKHAIVISFIIGALLTPPDIITQLCVAIPLTFLHEIAITSIKIKDGMVWKRIQKSKSISIEETV